MPCYSRIQTILIEIDTIMDAARKLGIEVERVDENYLRLIKGGSSMTLERQPGEKQFYTRILFGSQNESILQPLTAEYAKTQVKRFAAKRGYQFSVDPKTKEYVLTSYR